MRCKAFVAGVVIVVVGLDLGCENQQDLGSHAPGRDGGVAPPREDSPFDVGRSGKLFFVTANLYTGDLATQGGAPSGIVGGDNLCNAEARSAGVGGVFKAWLSTSSENARDRIAPVGPWLLIDGDTIFRESAVGGLPMAFARYAANGDDFFFSDDKKVWTGTNAAGTVNSNGQTCAGWTSDRPTDRGAYGLLNRTTRDWTDAHVFEVDSQTSPCSDRQHLYCFEQ